jgi:DNA-binding transcriptional LysR family regulator
MGQLLVEEFLFSYSSVSWKFKDHTVIIHPMHSLRSIDLNLLTVLDALLTERHVTRASEQLGMSQPAVSHALSRLRQMFDDPLFVRGPTGLVPTARALALTGPLRHALDHVRSMVVVPQFDPGASTICFRLAMSDYGAALILPRLLAYLRANAPGIELIVIQDSREEMARRVADGELDLAIGVFPSLAPDLRSSLILEERFQCLVDRDNPRLRRGRLSLEEYLAAPHVLVSVRGEPVGEVESALADLGRSRRVVAILPHFNVAPNVIVGTDLVLTLASRGLAACTADERLLILDPPFRIPAFTIVQVWHARNDASQALQWLRSLIGKVAEC